LIGRISDKIFRIFHKWEEELFSVKDELYPKIGYFQNWIAQRGYIQNRRETTGFVALRVTYLQLKFEWMFICGIWSNSRKTTLVFLKK